MRNRVNVPSAGDETKAPAAEDTVETDTQTSPPDTESTAPDSETPAPDTQTSPPAPDAPMDAPSPDKEEDAAASSSGSQDSEEKKEEPKAPEFAPEAPAAPVVPQEEAPVRLTPSGVAEGEMVTMVDEFTKLLEKAKQEGQTGETMEVIRLGAVQLLKEVNVKFTDLAVQIEEMKKMETDIDKKQKGLTAAETLLQDRSAGYRSEKDAYQKLRAISDEEFFALLEEVRKRTA